MVLVAIKQALLGPEKKSQLLPTARSYDTIGNNEEYPYNSSSSTVMDEDDTASQTTTTTTSSRSTGFVDPRVMSDIIIGLSDGLTVPFALTAGLSGLGDSKLVITGGLAELVSGAISMGLGGYLAAQSEVEYYDFQVARERIDFKECPGSAEDVVHEVLSEYKLSPETIKCVVSDMEKNPKSMVDFVIRFGRGLEEPAEGRQFSSALTIGLSYFLGGFVPLLPYFFSSTVGTGLQISVIVMLFTLFAFGALKTIFSLGSDCGRTQVLVNGLKMTAIGAIAAGAAWGLVRAIE